jgi:hypothetical protein
MVTPVLRSVSLEVRYAKKLLYLDRCGSAADALEAMLGAPFQASVPTMEAAEIKNEAEQIVFKFGPNALAAEHQFAGTAVRLLDLVGDAWKVVAERLEVRDRVIRVGMRFFYVSPTASPEAASAAILSSSYLNGSSSWAPFGSPTDASLTMISNIDAERSARIAISGVRSTGAHEMLNERILKFLPAFAVQTDIDVYTTSQSQRSMGPGQLKEYAKSAAQWARNSAHVLHRQILGEST